MSDDPGPMTDEEWEPFAEANDFVGYGAPKVPTDADGDLFRALLDIVYFGGGASVRLEHHGTQASRDVIVIRDRVYGTDNAEDRHKLIEYARRVRHRVANEPIEDLP